jgi:hypothetical protein
MIKKKLNMKRKNLILAVLPLFMVVLALQSCKKDEPMFQVYYAFTEPTAVAPLDGSTVKITGTTVDLKWAATDADGDSPLADVYFGTSETPPLYKAANAALTLTVPVQLGVTYYWHVTMIDANKVMTYGPTWSFTIFEPVGIFVGLFNADEPAEDYSYDVTFVKTSANTILTDNYWNSGWNATFTLDFTAKTYSMPVTTWSAGYSGQEAGTIDPATGKMVGNYTIWQTKNGVKSVIETGVHTYTRK